ncbi:60s ribosomal protein mitochondrial, partial [Colletotrichum incanum]
LYNQRATARPGLAASNPHEFRPSQAPRAPQETPDTMFGAFRMTSPLSSGLLWKIPWRLSKFQKRRQRQRLRAVDDVVATVDAALAKKGETVAALERWKDEMPTEAEMLPRDKYTMFDRKEKKYRKGIHKLPKWTRVSQRLNPPGY